MGLLREALASVLTLAAFFGIVAVIGWTVWKYQRRKGLARVLKRHFRPTDISQISVTERQFPVHIRADLQRAVNDFVENCRMHLFASVHGEHQFLGGVSFSSLLDESLIKVTGSTVAGPPQYEQIDVGEDQPIQVLKSGLWLLERRGAKLAILYAPLSNMSECGVSQRVRIELATPGNEGGRKLAEEFFKWIEAAVLNAQSYRGKVLSLEQESSYFGQASGIKVHRLKTISRDQVVLPRKTLELLDRNVIQFVQTRNGLAQVEMATKKGLLFYGPPGTGKTHTIRYLAGSLAGHTTFLISAEQVGLLGEYMILARLLQPAIVVIEDVDLIARERTSMRNRGSEVLLNKLLNEMDGLREDADILFILTTNRPEQLETALASRPGRIDQAIEFPLPDAAGRAKLISLYSRGMKVSDELVHDVVKRTEKVSASFIKELMRRAAQFQLERGGSRELSADDVKNALDEMLFSGGSLNLKLLGAEGRISDEPE